MASHSEFYCEVCGKDYHTRFGFDQHKGSASHKRLVALGLHKNMHINNNMKPETDTNSLNNNTSLMVPPPSDLVPYRPHQSPFGGLVRWAKGPGPLGIPHGVYATVVIAMLLGFLDWLKRRDRADKRRKARGDEVDDRSDDTRLRASKGFGFSNLLEFGVPMGLISALLFSKTLRTELMGWINTGKELGKFFRDWEK